MAKKRKTKSCKYVPFQFLIRFFFPWRELKVLTIVDLFSKCFASLKNTSKFVSTQVSFVT